MKKVGFFILIAGIACSLPLLYVKANDSNRSNNTYASDPFSTMEETDKVVQLPEGGYLKGEATLITEDGTEIQYNSETDPNAITVKEAREEIAVINK